jgi:microsomal dipeptidase-like Zn-dependent dipeptidase
MQEIERNGQELTEKKRRAIPFLVAAKDIESGCKSAGITTTCFYAWVKDDTFSKALQAARNEFITDAMNTLKSHVGKAVDELAKLLASKNEEIRRKAANNIIELSLRWHEAGEIEDRLEQIERIIVERRTYR